MGRDLDGFRAFLQPVKLSYHAFASICSKTTKIQPSPADRVLGGLSGGF
jgi:hypothetical protein